LVVVESFTKKGFLAFSFTKQANFGIFYHKTGV